MKIYLCDLVHSYLGVGTSMFPLNIGYIAAYAKKHFPKLEVELFKYPEDFIKKFKEEKPDVVGFSNYVWSANLNNKMADWVKLNSPQTSVVFGGPNIDYHSEAFEKFFKTHPSVDFYVLYQGEEVFLNLIKAGFQKKDAINGVVFYNKSVILGERIPRIKNLNSIPSPYLTGILDKFFDTNLIPIAETSRGCPYRCTYCCQGHSSYNQIEFFDLERIKEELNYIAEHVKNTNLFIFADSNFGIADRDIEIAKYLAELTKRTGYPREVNANWAKNQPKILEMAKILKNLNLIISLQSLDEVVLSNIKRTNIQIPVFKEILKKADLEGGIVSGTEIILGLPGETKESHLETLRKLFDWGMSYIICFNAIILEGSELSAQRSSGEFECKGKFRLIDNSFGEYEGMKIFEIEEGIRSTPVMSEEDTLFFRPVHWIIQFLWNYRFYYDLLKYLQTLGTNPLDFVIKLIEEADSKAPQKVKDIFNEFKKGAKNEWFDTPEALQKHYEIPENFQWLKEGNYGKMNGKYIFKVLMESKEEFENYLCNMACSMPGVDGEKVKEIMRFLSAAIVDFRGEGDVIFNDKKLENGLVLTMPEDRKESLKKLLKQYNHPNKNVTLRKMSEYMDIRDFFFTIKK